jgi:hypothetical protein
MQERRMGKPVSLSKNVKCLWWAGKPALTMAQRFPLGSMRQTRLFARKAHQMLPIRLGRRGLDAV